MTQDIADRLLMLDRERRAALARQDYMAARSIRLEMNIIQALTDFDKIAGEGGDQKATHKQNPSPLIFEVLENSKG